MHTVLVPAWPLLLSTLTNALVAVIFPWTVFWDLFFKPLAVQTCYDEVKRLRQQYGICIVHVLFTYAFVVLPLSRVSLVQSINLHMACGTLFLTLLYVVLLCEYRWVVQQLWVRAVRYHAVLTARCKQSLQRMQNQFVDGAGVEPQPLKRSERCAVCLAAAFAGYELEALQALCLLGYGMRILFMLYVLFLGVWLMPVKAVTYATKHVFGAREDGVFGS